MTPTEVLAWQHYEKVKNYLRDLPVKVAILTGSISNKEKEEIREKIKKGEVDIVVGTHSLLREEVSFKSLALVVIDEQHRFGVWQRVKLREKGESTDVLVMTATPIPRTLSLTLYGDLDVSIIRSLPPGRSRENTVTVVLDKKHRQWAYKKIREEVEKGHQAYIICPLIEESDKLRVKAVNQEARRLRERVFPDLRVEILHGRRKHQEKEEIMRKFASGELDILISTTVIEVGIDVPNATVMLIEDADRFGLSQLHQLRGRIGRGKFKSYCILFGDPTTEEGKKRLEVFSRISDGFKLAEEDLKIRGEGEIFGIRQSGITDLKVAELVRDFPLLLRARKDAFELVEKNDLTSPDKYFLFMELKRRFEKSLDWLSYG
jgi:ATP-dependent DNA helicase RecG